MEEIFVRTIPLPPKVHGFTSLDADGDYNVFINESLSSAARERTLIHEIGHISEKHLEYFYRDRADADQIEREEHEK